MIKIEAKNSLNQAQAVANPELPLAAWLEDFKIQGHSNPGQSHGFQAKPGWNSTRSMHFLNFSVLCSCLEI
jgi:hypothetical protein